MNTAYNTSLFPYHYEDCQMEDEVQLTCQGDDLKVTWETNKLKPKSYIEMGNTLDTIKQLKSEITKKQKEENGLASRRWLQMVVPDRTPP